jgi:prolyl-tRNA synthetase
VSAGYATNFTQWYLDAIKEAEIISQGVVRGTMVLRPRGMAVWESIMGHFNGRFKKKGVQNVYLPSLIPLSFFSKEAEHVEGFAPECATVTHYRLCEAPKKDGEDILAEEEGGGKRRKRELIPDPEAALAEPCILRPTSETLFWHHMKDWILSYKDLPMKLNQWVNIVRWEMRTRPFLRNSEFLWQEGHTAHSSVTEAITFTQEMLYVYHQGTKELLALPTLVGVKSERERFASAKETFTIEAFLPNGFALQSGTSHFLGSSFAEAMDVTFKDEAGGISPCQGTSWGVSTRLMGALIMSHGDERGLIFPPAVAPVQVRIVPILKSEDPSFEAIHTYIQNIKEVLEEEGGFRVDVDDMRNEKPFRKFVRSEQQGVPLRIDIGQREVTNGECVLVNRLTNEKKVMSTSSGGSSSLVSALKEEMDSLQSTLYERARLRLLHSLDIITNYQELQAKVSEIAADHLVVDPQQQATPSVLRPSVFLVPWIPSSEEEEKIQHETKATLRCLLPCLSSSSSLGVYEPNEAACAYSLTEDIAGSFTALLPEFDLPDVRTMPCVYDESKPATVWAVFSRAY